MKKNYNQPQTMSIEFTMQQNICAASPVNINIGDNIIGVEGD